MFAMYSIGILTGIAAAGILKKTLLRGPAPPFVMELPSYKMPGLRIVLHRMLEQGWAFLYRAGTLIVAVSILVWGLAYYPHDSSQIDQRLLSQQADLQARLTAATTRQAPEAEVEGIERDLAQVENKIDGQYLQHSLLGQMGRWIEPAVKPLGWDWRIGCAAIASFPAREVVVATLGVIYNLGDEQDESSEDLKQRLRSATWEGTNKPVFTLPVALSVMVFFALCAQCSSTLVIMRRETGTWLWPLFTFGYMTTLAYLGALATYNIGTWLS